MTRNQYTTTYPLGHGVGWIVYNPQQEHKHLRWEFHNDKGIDGFASRKAAIAFALQFKQSLNA